MKNSSFKFLSLVFPHFVVRVLTKLRFGLEAHIHEVKQSDSKYKLLEHWERI